MRRSICGILSTLSVLRFRADGFEICIDFSFFFAVAVALLISDEMLAYSTLLACAAHEAGHFFAMLLCGVKPDRLLLYGGGACIRAAGLCRADFSRQIVIALAGASVNLALCALTSECVPVFAAVNLVLGAFNLLPLTCLDGGSVADIIARKRLSCRAYGVFSGLSHALDCVFTAVMIFAALSYGGALMLAVPVYTMVLQLYKDE